MLENNMSAADLIRTY